MQTVYLAVLLLAASPPTAQTIGRPLDDMASCRTARLMMLADWPITHRGETEPALVCVEVGR